MNYNWGWQVTVCFYAALHFTSAHIENKTGKNYLSHTMINDAINPSFPLSLSKFDDQTYLAYTKLYNLSRRSRYLINENQKNRGAGDTLICCLTHSIHFMRAIKYLETILNYMVSNYALSFSTTDIKCIDLNGETFNNFKIIP